MGSGVPSGLQNQHEGLRASQVGSIPTLPRQKKALSHEDSAFLSFKFEVESLMWMGKNLKAIVSNIIHQTFLLDFSSVLSAISFVSSVLTASLNSRRLLPKARPIVGSFPGPNTIRAIIKMSSNSPYNTITSLHDFMIPLSRQAVNEGARVGKLCRQNIIYLSSVHKKRNCIQEIYKR